VARAKKTKDAKTDTKTPFDGDIARKIWLAGVGAYGRAYEEAQGAAEKFAAGANQTFDELVAKGEKMEDTVRDRISKAPAGKKVATLVADAAKKSKEVTDKRRAALDARIDTVRKSLGETFAPFNMAALGQAVEALTQQVEALTAEVADLKAEKAKKPAEVADLKAEKAKKPAKATPEKAA
jgi:poly(hydroxyalkanoate) granule-associated protein